MVGARENTSGPLSDNGIGGGNDTTDDGGSPSLEQQGFLGGGGGFVFSGYSRRFYAPSGQERGLGDQYPFRQA